ncbi:MAG: choice-of-anchor V domain-containing protein [Bacteroidota bacterium]
MRKLILLIATALSVFGYVVVADQPDKTMKASGAHPGSTAAPGEQTCAQSGCHVNATISPGDGVNTFQLGNNATGYTPGETYPVKITAQRAGTSRFGFEVVALDRNNKNVGTWKMTDSKRTQIINDNVNGFQRLYVTHKLASTPAVSPGVGEWAFEWTAPTNYKDSVKFYYVTNATNNDNTNQGDALYLSSVAFAANAPNSVSENAENKAIKVFPNPAAEYIQLSGVEKESTLEIFSNKGTKLISGKADNERISLKGFPAGSYIIQITDISGKKETLRFVKN